MARTALSKKTRFEVFKRDDFTCQYCGKKSPEVILHVDHIEPVSKGGDNSILNLVTSCVDCNAGKSDVRLSDESALAKQRAQLEELNERREQLEMLLRWREGLSTIKEDEVDAAVSAYEKHVPGWELNDTGIRDLRAMVRKFGLAAVLDSIEAASEKYLAFTEDGRATDESVRGLLKRISGFCALKNKPEGEKKLYYARGILRKRIGYINEHWAMDLLRQAYALGADPDRLCEYTKTVRYWSHWRDGMEAIIAELKNG